MHRRRLRLENTTKVYQVTSILGIPSSPGGGILLDIHERAGSGRSHTGGAGAAVGGGKVGDGSCGVYHISIPSNRLEYTTRTDALKVTGWSRLLE